LKKNKIKKSLIKVEAQNMMDGLDTQETYRGVNRNLSTQLNNVKAGIE
jgi:hypothetical protein